MLGVEQEVMVSVFLSFVGDYFQPFIVKNPVELGPNDWEEFSDANGVMDFNKGNCYWKRRYNWTVTGSDYKIPEM